MATGIKTESVKISRYVNGMSLSDVMATLLTIFHYPKKVFELVAEVDLKVDSIDLSRKGR